MQKCALYMVKTHRHNANALTEACTLLHTRVKCIGTCSLLRYMCIDLHAGPWVYALCQDWFARDRTLNFATASSLSMCYSQWSSELSRIEKDGQCSRWPQEERSIKTERKKGKVKCRNTGQEIKTERRKKESGTEREAGREGWIEIGV